MRKGLGIGTVAVAVAASIGVGDSLLDRSNRQPRTSSTANCRKTLSDVSLSYDGCWFWVAGYVACTEDEHVEMNAWIVQPSTGAGAEGCWHKTRTGESRLWNTSSVPSQNSYAFLEGAAELCPTSRTRSNGGATDVFQGCSEVAVAPTA
jgi:hypothetical protein